MSFFRLSVACIALIQLSCYLEEWIFKALPGFHYHWTVARRVLHRRRQRRAQTRGAADSVRRHRLLAAGTGLGKLAYRYLNFATGLC